MLYTSSSLALIQVGWIFIDRSALFWVILGVALCLGEFLLPATQKHSYRFLALIPGAIALLVAIFAWRYARINIFGVQIFFVFRYQLAYWVALSTACLLWVRPLLLRRKQFDLPMATEAKTITEIIPGDGGRVLYEGVSWQARCDNQTEAIAPQQKVIVLRREGNTLIVAPEHFFQE
ncbi:MAG: NfeD family protein [Cyanobacteria bacterium SBLK]|nr:NfeD family protein [Cyanobacteria bacterium SBLK]